MTTPTPTSTGSTALCDAEVSLTALRISDLERAAEFYVDGCGLTRLHEVSTDTFDAVILGRSDGRGGGIELMRERGAVDAVEIGNGFAKIVLSVADVTAAVESAVAHGGTVVMAPRALEQMGGLMLGMVHDPDGYTVEFIQRAS